MRTKVQKLGGIRTDRVWIYFALGLAVQGTALVHQLLQQRMEERVQKCKPPYQFQQG